MNITEPTSTISVIQADWPVSDRIKAFTTTRAGGVSEGCFKSLNLAKHVNDNIQHVQKNRQLLIQQLQLPRAPIWLNQTHSTQAVSADRLSPNAHNPQADAIYSHQNNTICSVLTADCLPLLICNKQANCVAAVHAGWQGLAAGVIENSIAAIKQKPDDLYVWIGPAIGADVFEVGEDVRDAFMQRSANASSAFKQVSEKKYLADMLALAKIQLKNIGIDAVYGGDYCSYQNKSDFFSFRRDGETGRMASLIWIEE